jgi:hypothetical protein
MFVWIGILTTSKLWSKWLVLLLEPWSFKYVVTTYIISLVSLCPCEAYSFQWQIGNYGNKYITTLFQNRLFVHGGYSYQYSMVESSIWIGTKLWLCKFSTTTSNRCIVYDSFTITFVIIVSH